MAQRSKASAKAAPPVPLKTITPDVKCPSLIGMGVKTVRSFCDVPAGRDPAQGIVITLPPHTGPGTLSFDLHARHIYSEDEMKRGKAYARYRAVIGALTMKGDLLDRGAVDAEFRSVLRQLITYMMEDPRTITAAVETVWVAKAIERIGDHSKNIAEQVIYIVKGTDVRHTSFADIEREIAKE